jgi:hypothetical protein
MMTFTEPVYGVQSKGWQRDSIVFTGCLTIVSGLRDSPGRKQAQRR